MTENGSASFTKPTVNGEARQSQTLNHVTSYPLVDDLITFYRNNSLGAKSIEAFYSLYHTFAEPVVPYLQTPYSIAHPYLQKADSFGDASLETIDHYVPAIKSTNYEKLKGNAYNVASYPFHVAGSTKQYVFDAYYDESEKVGGEGVIAFGKSVVSTQLRIVSDTLHAVHDFIQPRANELGQKYDEVKKTGAEKAQRAKKSAQKQADQLSNSQ